MENIETLAFIKAILWSLTVLWSVVTVLGFIHLADTWRAGRAASRKRHFGGV